MSNDNNKVFGNGVVVTHNESGDYQVKFDKFETVGTVSRNVLNIVLNSNFM